MRTLMLIAALTLALVLAGGGFGSSAAAQTTCTKDRGTVTCTTTEPVGNSGNTKVNQESQKGSFNSSHTPNCTYTNPGGHTRTTDCD